MRLWKLVILLSARLLTEGVSLRDFPAHDERPAGSLNILQVLLAHHPGISDHVSNRSSDPTWLILVCI